MPDSPTTNRITLALLAILSTAFLAWAGVVYQASQNAVEQTTKLNAKIIEIVSGIQSNQASLLTEVRITSEAFKRHEDSDWHIRAGETIPRLQDALDGLRHDVQDLERQLRTGNSNHTEGYGTR